MPRSELSRVRTIPACPVPEITGCKNYLCPGQGCHGSVQSLRSVPFQREEATRIICAQVSGSVQSIFVSSQRQQGTKMIVSQVNAVKDRTVPLYPSPPKHQSSNIICEFFIVVSGPCSLFFHSRERRQKKDFSVTMSMLAILVPASL